MNKRRSGAAVALFGVGTAAVVAGVTVAVLSSLQILRGIGLWGWWMWTGAWSAARSPSAPNTNPAPVPTVDFLSPGLVFAVGVLVLLVGWVILIKAMTRAWPQGRDRGIPPDLSDDAKRMLFGD